MSYEVTLTPEAKHDLREIYRYIAVELQSEQNANGQLNRLEENILKLDEMPERFRVYDREPWRSRNLRVMPVDHYLVFYIPDHQSQIVISFLENAGHLGLPHRPSGPTPTVPRPPTRSPARAP